MGRPQALASEIYLNRSGAYNTADKRLERLKRYREKRNTLFTGTRLKYPKRSAATLKKRRFRGKFLPSKATISKQGEQVTKRERAERESAALALVVSMHR